ncbi:MAG: replication/repair protein RecF, partial [Belnapia sp.]|nr:replication/repair protein RecF [Belnapia sp.]
MAPPPALLLTRLMLRDFRSYPALTVPFHSRIVVVSGDNGVGKTNLLEAISLLGPGRGLRGARTADFGRREAGQPLPWAAAGRFESIHWSGFDIGTGTPEGGPPERRTFRLDGAPVRGQADLAERIA